jgi:hypothetical protein
MAFNGGGIPHTEPAYANVTECADSEVHGVAFLMSKESQEELDRTENAYAKKMVDLQAYDGRMLKGFVYYKTVKTTEPELAPSKRYLGVLVKGTNIKKTQHHRESLKDNSAKTNRRRIAEVHWQWSCGTILVS